MEDPILRHLGEGVLELNPSGRILRANPAAIELLWVPGDPVLRATLAALWGEDAGKVTAALARLAGPTGPDREVLELVRGERHLRVTLTLLRSGGERPGFLGVLQDITAFKRRIEELGALNQVASILNSAHELPRVLELAIERIAAALHAEAASLLLREDDTGELVFAVALGPVADRIRGRRLPRGRGIAGWVARTGEALLVPDASTDPRFSRTVDQESGFVTRSILCAPLKTGQDIIGVVQLLNHAAGRPFSRADLQLLEAIALHAAAVIEKAKLLEREKELTALLGLSTLRHEFNNPLGSLECYLAELFNSVAHQNPDMVPIIEKAIQRLKTLRQMSQ